MADLNRYYKILELEPGASLQDVKQAYRDLAFVWHPDRYSHNSRLQKKAQERLREINEAYEQLQHWLRVPHSLERQRSAQPVPVSDRRQPAKQTGGEPRSRDRWGGTVSVSEPDFRTPSKLKTRNSLLADLPWGWLTGAFSSHALTGWVLTLTAAPPWMWGLAAGASWLGSAILASEQTASHRAWLVALISAGAVGGLIAGNEAGGWLTGVAWAAAGASLGAIAGLEAEPRTVVGVVTVAGVAIVAGLLVGTGAGNWVASVVGATIWAGAGLMFGAVAEAAFKPGAKMGVGALMGFGVGAWAGVGAGAGRNAVSRAVASAGSKTVFAAWAAIGVVAGAIAQMVAGEKLIESGGGLYTFMILASTSVLGLGLGGILADWIF